MSETINSKTIQKINWNKIYLISGISAVVLLFLAILFRIIFVYSVDNYELGYEFDRTNGKITALNRTGYFIRNPFLRVVHTIDLRPMQVRIEANNRVLNAKLVKFRPEGLLQFVSMHGRGNYDVTGTSSSSVSTSGFADIMKCYAYENYGNTNNDSIIELKYKFIKILNTTSGANINLDKQ